MVQIRLAGSEEFLGGNIETIKRRHASCLAN